MKHQVSLTVRQILGWECPYNGCSFNLGGMCENKFHMQIEEEYKNEEIYIEQETTCNYCTTDDDTCPCGCKLEFKPNIYDGRLHGYYHECSNNSCILK